MVKHYNQAGQMQGLSSAQMHAIEGDLAHSPTKAYDAAIDSGDFFNFDVAVICMALHHIPEPGALIAKLVDRLKNGGVLVIIDWTLGQADNHQDTLDRESQQDPKSSHAAAHTISFDGFNREQIGRMFREAGCIESDYVELEKPTKVPDAKNGQKQMFFARSRRV